MFCMYKNDFLYDCTIFGSFKLYAKNHVEIGFDSMLVLRRKKK